MNLILPLKRRSTTPEGAVVRFLTAMFTVATHAVYMRYAYPTNAARVVAHYQASLNVVARTAGGAAVGSAAAGAGAAPGAVIGGIGGAVVGGAVGWWAGTTITETVYDAVFTPAQKEEWVVVMCGDRPLRESDLR